MNYWPRTDRPDLIAELDFDRQCPNCGYNLRGLQGRSACPECGSVRGWNLSDEPVPWDDEQTFWTYLLTVGMVLASPHTYARHVWRPVWLDPKLAARFRRVAMWFAMTLLCALCVSITYHFAGPIGCAYALPFIIPAVVLWLNAVTLEPVRFVTDKAADRTSRRAQTLARYLSATLFLFPLQAPVLYVTWNLGADVPHRWLVSAVAHLLVLFLTLLPGGLAYGWLVYELVDVTVPRAMSIAMGRVVKAIVIAAIMLVVIPATVAAVATGRLGR